MKKLLYTVIFILLLIIVPDRVLKIYEDKKAEEKKREGYGGIFTAEQVAAYDKAVQFRLVPYEVFGLIPGFRSGTVNINSLGLRGAEIGEKKEGAYRIAVIGGSAVFGAEVVNDNLTFSKLLEKNLNERIGNNFEVINAGLPAYVSMQELVLFEDKIIGMKPDAVIVFDGFNDILTVLKRDKRPNYPWWFKDVERIYNTSISRLFIEKRLKKYRPTKLLLNWLESRKPSDMKCEVNPEQIAFYKRNLDLMCHLANAYGIDIVLVFQPVAFYKNSLTDKEKEAINKLDADYTKVLKEMCDLAKSAMEDAAKENGVAFIDGSSFFAGSNEDIFIDEVHFNQKGHGIIADSLYEILKPRINSLKSAQLKPTGQ